MTVRRFVVPPIKCQGIKVKLVSWIRAVAPPDYSGRWIEPFMGSGAVVFGFAPRKALLADSNPHIINFYRALTDGSVNSTSARRHLEREGALLSRTEGEHYYSVRERFNKTAAPLDFLFLNRACFNGMIRFNRSGGFNVPFCRKPERFAKAYITKICNQMDTVAGICASGNYEFKCQDYSSTVSNACRHDVLYCDPPYMGRHTDYYNGWSELHEHRLAQSLKESRAHFILSAWHSNAHRSNDAIDLIWSEYNIFTREHFYHVGAKESNRGAVLEALITNYASQSASFTDDTGQLLTAVDRISPRAIVR